VEVKEEMAEVQEESPHVILVQKALGLAVHRRSGYGSHATQAQSISTSCKAQIVLSASIFFTLM